MITKFLMNDMKSNKMTNSIVFIFICLASFLLSLVLSVGIHLNQSIDSFSLKSQPPHFMQMHLGDIDKERIENFAQSNAKIANFQILDFLNIDVNDIQLNGTDFKMKSQDNGFVCQSPHFDYLLDQQNVPVYPQVGEVYVPLTYLLEDTISLEDRLTVAGLKLVVKGGVRDGQMAPMLASSKRFVIHPMDYQKIKNQGKLEYLIEFRLKDPSQIQDLQIEYLHQGFEANGPTITAPIIKLINALTDGIVLGLMSLVALLIILVSLLCIHFSLRTKLEEDYRMIGVLKAIGIRPKRIKNLYRYKYRLLAALAGLAGLIGAFLIKPFFLEKIELFYGQSPSTIGPILAAFIGSCVVFALVTAYVSLFLRRIDGISPAQAIAKGYENSTKTPWPPIKLRKCPQMNTGLFMANNKILEKKKYFLLYGAILILLSLSMALPSSLYASIDSDDFISYLGLADVDVIAEVKDPDHASSLKLILDKDPRISSYRVFDQKNYNLLIDGKTAGKLWTRLGDSDDFHDSYIKGRPSTGESEISISYLSANELDKSLGDKLTLSIDDKVRDLTITGIYSDMTNGGRTARASFEDPESPNLGQTLFIRLNDPMLAESFAESLSYHDINLEAYPVNAYKDEFLGPILSKIRLASLGSLGISLFLAWIISYLFFNMLISQDKAELIVQKILGIRLRQIRTQYLIMAAITGLFSLTLAFTLTHFIGGFLLETFMSSMGVAHMPFQFDWLKTLLIHPALFLLIISFSSFLASRQISALQIADYEEV